MTSSLLTRFARTAMVLTVGASAAWASAQTAAAPTTVPGAYGHWRSIATEVRPSAAKNADGSLKAFYLKRDFTLNPDNTFSLNITNYADPYGKVPLSLIALRGHMQWEGAHGVVAGAQKVHFIADQAYEVTPLHPGFVAAMNAAPAEGIAPWELNKAQSLLGKSFAPFGLKAGQHFGEYDLVYVANGLQFWGARHVDGRGFDTEANRPTNLQIPMQKD